MIGNTAELELFFLVLMRMSGFIFLNPIFGRSNIPSTVKSGMVMLLSLNIYTFLNGQEFVNHQYNLVLFAVVLIKEFFIGFVVGYIVSLFFFIVEYVGTIIDFLIGFSMANVYDPQTNISVTVTSSLFNWLFIALFFATDSHLTLLRIMIDSGKIIPYGDVSIPPELTFAITDLFSQCVVMVMKLVFPMLAIQMILEVSIGIVMKMIPQIDIFVVNIQLKVFVGLLVILVLLSPLGETFQNLLVEMMGNIRDILTLL